ncbi:epoxide hydrolase family protein [Actinomadura sp. DC4]|uniref:epoxide hydrolase family protein n=1 Tax=Actinomadura sp. DC4 TaxID=3055069 RepID=UPI0025B251B3|nr:epoxide hydrolase family protein [Actinomadura sp. DC4]MDN3352500.1 epoxide hydrolase [Actinomadura sp. DC4]
MSVSPFRLDVSDDVLTDLRTRIRRTRFTPASATEPWKAGTDPAYLRSLLNYWADGFDWHKAQDDLNLLPHHLADVAGQRIHFIHVRAAGRPRLPLILTHGWPSSFVEMLPLVPLLTDPARFGGDPDDAFDVVIPSLPGFLYSDLPAGRPMTRDVTADIWHTLMTEVLGYSAYGAFGGDIGAGVTGWLAARYPESVTGIHLIHPSMPANVDDPPLSDTERAFLAALDAFDERDRGYSEIMCTRPDTIAAALQDSPAGLAAWLVDKYHDWCDGDLESRFDRDDLLTVFTLYWATGTIGSSFRQYYDWTPGPARPLVTVPVGVTMSAEPVYRDFPRSLAERSFSDIRQWRGPTKGGHFMPLEEPEMLATDLRTFFRPLR